MSLIDNKELTKLVKTCRKLGIKEFKCSDFEFTLQEAPATKRRSKSEKKRKIVLPDQIDNSNEEIPTDGLSQEELLYWSTGIETEKADS